MKDERSRDFNNSNSIAEGLALVRKHRSMLPPGDLNDSDNEKYAKAVQVINQASELRDILGGDVSIKNAVKHFEDLVNRLRSAPKDSNSHEIEEKIVRIVSAFGLGSKGIGNILAGIQDGGLEVFEAWRGELRKSRLRNDIQEALEFIKK